MKAKTISQIIFYHIHVTLTVITCECGKSLFSCKLLDKAPNMIHQYNNYIYDCDHTGPPLPEPPFDPATVSCDFEAGLCHYTLDDGARSSWRRVSVKHDMFLSGDHTTGAGGMVLVEDEDLT